MGVSMACVGSQARRGQPNAPGTIERDEGDPAGR